MKEVFAALGVALLAPTYVAANTALGLALCFWLWPKLRDWLWPRLRRSWRLAVAAGRRQLDALSRVRLWTTTVLCGMALAACSWSLQQELSLQSMALTLLGYVLVTGALALSLPARLPVVQKIWREPSTRLCVLALTPFLAFVGKGYAAQWIGDLVGISGANASMALLAGTVFLLCVVPAFLLAVMTIVFEIAALVVLGSTGFKNHAGRRYAWIATCFIMFFGTYLGVNAALQLVGARLGQALVLAIAFDFDASPARHCALRDDERPLALGQEPFIKALHLGSSQEKALLLRRSPALFRPTLLRDLRAEPNGLRHIQVLRVVECYKSS